MSTKTKKEVSPKMVKTTKPSEEGHSHKYTNLIEEVYRAFDFFNQKFAQGTLVRPVIMIASSQGKNALGWFGNKFWKDGEDEVSEINLSAEYLSRDCDEVLETLLHEMAHLKNAQADIFDCSKTQYHNKAFKTSAESFGLKVEKIGYRGYAKTDLTDVSKAAIAELNPDRSLYNIYKKTFLRKKDDRYIPLIVNRTETMESILEELSETCGSKKSAVTEAILQFYTKTTGKEVELEDDGEED